MSLLQIKLTEDHCEEVTYNFSDFPIRSKQTLLSQYPNMACANHWHDDFEFTIILKGNMSYYVNGKSYILTEGQAIFINSKQMHYGYSDQEEDCMFLCIILHPSLITNLVRINESYITPISEDSTHPYFIFDPTIIWQKHFIKTLMQLHKLCDEEREGFELQVMSLYYSIAYTLYHHVKKDQSYNNTPPDKRLEIMHHMVGYIQNNYQHKITLSEIAASGNVCRSACCEIFQLFLNKSPFSYLTEYRLQKSIELLHQPPLSITEIALRCGFNSSSYFTEIFHRELKCTPTQYRKNHIFI